MVYPQLTQEFLKSEFRINYFLSGMKQIIIYYGTDPQTAYYGVNQADPDNPLVVVSSLAKYFSHYMRYIRPYAERKTATTTDTQFDPVAFENIGGNYSVVVNSLTGGSFIVGGLPAGSYHIRYTTGSETMTDPGDQTISAGQHISTSIPAAGVLTIFADPPPVTSIDDWNSYSGSGIRILQNPFYSQTILEIDEVLKNASLTIVNYFGQTVRHINHISGHTVNISRDDLPSGLYFFQLRQDAKKISGKLVIIDN